MDITKRFDRILSIFFYLQSKSSVSIVDLMDKFQVSERTLFRDLKSLEIAGIPIINEVGRGYHIMEGFRMQAKSFTEAEVISLMIAEKIVANHETQYVKEQF